MSLKFLRPVIAAGCAVALSSCSLFQKDPPATASDPYAAANPYAGGAQPPAAGYPAANAYGAGSAYGAGAPDAGGYAQPNYNPPAYNNPPPATGYGAGYAGGYSTPAAPPSGSSRTHRVVKGDTLSGISRRYGVGITDLMRANNLQSDVIRIDQKLVIP